MSAIWNSQGSISTALAKDALKKPLDMEAMAAELEMIKGRLSDQAHARSDVGYQFGNLWFAGQKQNWPLAEFYWKETRSHLAWAVRIIPKRKITSDMKLIWWPSYKHWKTAP